MVAVADEGRRRRGGGGRRGRALRKLRVLGRPRGEHASDATGTGTCRGAATDVCLFEPSRHVSFLSAHRASPCTQSHPPLVLSETAHDPWSPISTVHAQPPTHTPLSTLAYPIGSVSGLVAYPPHC